MDFPENHVSNLVRIDAAFPRTLANEALAILWRATGCNPHDPATWTQPSQGTPGGTST